MSKENYRRLGDYIREVDVRNRDLEVKELVGLTINKAFIPSVANTIGTDLSNYKVIRKEQFACSLMQVSRDGKMPVAMFEGECAIMSPAYPMFEVVDKNILLPQYLMMWFSRNEFDREASFYAVGGVRGSLTWQDFCDMTLPIPPIEQQRKIVAEYETISKRIRLNEQMITRLEETAQTLYRQIFVDGIDKENLPEGWRKGTIGEFCKIFTGRKDVSETSENGLYTFFSCSPTTFKSDDFIYDGEAVLIAGNGSYTGRVNYFKGKFDLYQRTYACTLLQNVDKSYMLYLYCCLKFGFEKKYMGGSRGSSIPYIIRGDISEYQIVVNDYIIKTFYRYIRPIVEDIRRYEYMTGIMNDLRSLLLAKME